MKDNNTEQHDERTLEHGWEKVKITHIPDTIKYLEAVPGDEPWINMVNAYFKLKELSNENDIRI